MMMKLSTASLLAAASTANASLRGGPVVMSSNAVLSAVPATLAPSLFMAGSVGEEDGTVKKGKKGTKGKCGPETAEVWQDAGLNTAMDGLAACPMTKDEDSKTATLDFSSCEATKVANTACSGEFVFNNLGNNCSF